MAIYIVSTYSPKTKQQLFFQDGTHAEIHKFKDVDEVPGCLFVCGGSLTSGQLVKGSFQTACRDEVVSSSYIGTSVRL